jgi:hypothetical protein
MDFNYSIQQKKFNSSFTCREDDGVKVYLVDLKEDGHKKLLGNQLNMSPRIFLKKIHGR